MHMDNFVLICGSSIMMRTLIAIILAFTLTSATVYARGVRGLSGQGPALTPEQLSEQKARHQKKQREFEAWQQKEKQQARAEEDKETKGRSSATAAGVEQVKMFKVWDGSGYSTPYFAAEKGLNAWIRNNPNIQIIRVVGIGSTVLVFYNDKNDKK